MKNQYQINSFSDELEDDSSSQWSFIEKDTIDSIVGCEICDEPITIYAEGYCPRRQLPIYAEGGPGCRGPQIEKKIIISEN